MIPLLLALGLAAQEGGAQPHPAWLRVRAPAIELVTDAGAARAREAAFRLQRFADVLRAAAPVPPLDTRSALVLAVADEGAFRGMRPWRGGRAFEVDGFVQGGPARTLVAVNLASGRAAPLETLFHEYVHLALNGALPAQPLWVAEGLADLFSDWREVEGGARLGALRPEHVRLMLQRPLLPTERVLAAGYNSPEFLQAETRDLLYAQSWALVRLAYDGGSAAGRARLLQYLEGLASGLSPSDAFESAFGYAPAEAQPRVLRSLSSVAGPPPLQVALPAASDATLEVEPAPPGVAAALIGELLLRQDRDTDASRRFEAALAEDPDLVAAHEGLAHLALRRGRWDEARRHLEGALRRQPPDPAALYRMADLLAREASSRQELLSGPAERTAVDLLERAVALAPYFADAVEMLARLRPEPLGPRLRLVERALAHNPGRADLAFTLANLRFGAQDPQGAAAALILARDATHDEVQRFLAEHLLGRLGQAVAGTMEARGRLLALECRPDGALDFVLEAVPGSLSGGLGLVLKGGGSRPRAAAPLRLRLRAAAPTSVLLQDADGNPLQPELVCGPQRGGVSVRYRPWADPRGAGPAVDGTLLTLRFLDRG